MNEFNLNDIMSRASIEDDFCGHIEDHLKRMGAIDSDSHLDLGSIIEYGIPMDTFEEWY